jgi:hypothetical protein
MIYALGLGDGQLRAMWVKIGMLGLDWISLKIVQITSYDVARFTFGAMLRQYPWQYHEQIRCFVRLLQVY